ncbi:MAG: sodium/proton-translocating pyrophosphatase, partial [candidate division WOR-3 bacterium]
MHPLFWLTPVGSVLALLFAWYLSLSVRKFDEGTELMREIARAVREGARAYIKRQYGVVTIFFAVVFVILLIIALNRMLPIYVPFAFITGGFFSGLSGFIGLTQATASSARTANAARQSLNSGLRVAFAAGGVMGFVVVGLSLL